MSKDEKLVRSAWVLVHRCDGSYRGYPVGTVLVQDVHGHWLDFATWSAAAEFTRTRLEQVRQLREEMELLGSFEHEAEDNSERALITSAIARLQSIYATLTLGIRPEALEGVTR